MYDLIARWMPRRLVLLAFIRMVLHCRNSDDPEIIEDARYTANTIIQWKRVIRGEVEENR